MSDLVPGHGTLAVEIIAVYPDAPHPSALVQYRSKGLPDATLSVALNDVANVFHPEDGETP